MFLKIKNIPSVSWSSDKPLNLKPKASTSFFLCIGLIIFGLGEGLLIVSASGASPWSVLAQGLFLNIGFFCWFNNNFYKYSSFIFVVST
jgi:hypothetical protein